MFKKKMSQQGLAVFLLFSVVVSMLGGSLSVKAAGKEKCRMLYRQYVKQQQKKSKKKLYYAIVNASEDKMPVLLVTSEDEWMMTNKNAIRASVYSCSDGKVVYITDMQSTGSGYPLIKKGKYIFSGWHHSSQRLMVSGPKGYMESVDGFGMENAKCHKQSWVVVNGRKKNVATKKISEKKANSLDYYINAYGSGGNEIVFKKVK